MTDQMLHTPDGVRDIYNGECKQKLLLQDRLHAVLTKYGYRDIQTPTFEFFNIFSKEIGTTPSKDLYKFFDKDGNTLVLRPDFTPSVARSAAKYYAEDDMPVKLCYMGNTFINSSSYQGRLKETTQCGVELIGDGSVCADAEILAMVVDSLRASGLKEFQISVGHARFFHGLIEAAGLGEEAEEELRELLNNKNFFGVEEFVETLKELAPDMIIVAAFGQIIPKTILDMPKYGCLNIHASLLPKYRGAAPIQQAVIDGEKESGVTIMKMGVGLDTGDMISQAVVPLAEDETGGSLFDKLAEEGAELLIRTIPSIVDGTAVYTKQPEESPTPYAAMISKKMGLMDFTKSATELERLVRGMNPWPSAYTFLNGKTLKVWKCSVESGNCGKEAPGTITGVDKKGIHVACGTDKLVLEEVQLEGKKRMETDAFLRGYQVTEGIMLKDHKE